MTEYSTSGRFDPGEFETSSAWRAVRMPLSMWEEYAQLVGGGGRSADLKEYIDWRIDNPQVRLGPDIDGPMEKIHKLRVHHEIWAHYASVVPCGDWSADLRSYVLWRLENPHRPLPGRARTPVRRERPQPSYC